MDVSSQYATSPLKNVFRSWECLKKSFEAHPLEAVPCHDEVSMMKYLNIRALNFHMVYETMCRQFIIIILLVLHARLHPERRL